MNIVRSSQPFQDSGVLKVQEVDIKVNGFHLTERKQILPIGQILDIVAKMVQKPSRKCSSSWCKHLKKVVAKVGTNV